VLENAQKPEIITTIPTEQVLHVAPPFPLSMLENGKMQTCVWSTLHRGGKGQNANKMNFSNPCD